MLPSHEKELSATAFQLLVSLETYEQHMDVLVEARWDADLYMRATELFDEMRLYAASLPRVQVAWIEVLISRFELAEMLWQSRSATRTDGRLLGCHSRHKAAIASLRRRCSIYTSTAR
jgi:hypothetical protein